MRYTFKSVLELFEVLYAIGYTRIGISSFVSLFCEKHSLDIDAEQRTILRMIEVLVKQKKIERENDEIILWGLFSPNLRLVINDYR